MKIKTFYVKVFVQPPKGFKTKTYKGVCIAKSKEEATTGACMHVLNNVSKLNKGIEFKVTAKECIECDDFVFNTQPKASTPNP